MFQIPCKILSFLFSLKYFINFLIQFFLSITSPSKTSHKKVDPQIRKKLGISDNLLRFSVGIEDIEDLMLDLDKSLKNNVR